MLKTFAGALAVAGAALFVAPSAQAASVDGVSALTQELSAQTVTTRTTVKKRGNVKTRTVVRRRTYEAPKYYGYYGPTYYERPYSRPPAVTFGLGGWW
ncbi:MAG: hypothetical protein ACXWVI_09155 [Methyloceanibacter sp.]